MLRVCLAMYGVYLYMFDSVGCVCASDVHRLPTTYRYTPYMHRHTHNMHIRITCTYARQNVADTYYNMRRRTSDVYRHTPYIHRRMHNMHRHMLTYMCLCMLGVRSISKMQPC